MIWNSRHLTSLPLGGVKSGKDNLVILKICHHTRTGTCESALIGEGVWRRDQYRTRPTFDRSAHQSPISGTIRGAQRCIQQSSRNTRNRVAVVLRPRDQNFWCTRTYVLLANRILAAALCIKEDALAVLRPRLSG